MSEMSAEAQMVLTRATMSVLDSWKLGSEEMGRVLGMSETVRARAFQKYRSHQPFPDDPQVHRRADYILRDHPRCVNIFVSASKEARIERLMHIHHISTEAAEELMEKADKKRSAYYNYYSYKTWGAAETYHLCIDSSVLGIDGTVQFIKQFVKLKLGF